MEILPARIEHIYILLCIYIIDIVLEGFMIVSLAGVCVVSIVGVLFKPG